jgi:hypothetical protein
VIHNAAQLQGAIQERVNLYNAGIDRLRALASSEAENEVYDVTMLLREAVELGRVLHRLVPDLTVQQVHKTFGAPGDFGYENPIGAALDRTYRGTSR